MAVVLPFLTSDWNTVVGVSDTLATKRCLTLERRR